MGFGPACFWYLAILLRGEVPAREDVGGGKSGGGLDAVQEEDLVGGRDEEDAVWYVSDGGGIGGREEEEEGDVTRRWVVGLKERRKVWGLVMRLKSFFLMGPRWAELGCRCRCRRGRVGLDERVELHLVSDYVIIVIP